MKDNLFELLLDLFEQSLSQLQKSSGSVEQKSSDKVEETEQMHHDEYTLEIQPAKETSMRVFSYDEAMKMTKASYQFLMRMKTWGVIDARVTEIIINKLQESESRFVTLEETKWTIRNILSPTLTEEQLSFLDLVLYQTEDAFTIH